MHTLSDSCLNPKTSHEHPSYARLRDSDDWEMRKRRDYICGLFSHHRKSFPAKFDTDLQHSLPQSMYELVLLNILATVFPERLTTDEKNAGPDFCVCGKVWIEAVVPKCGKGNGMDSWPAARMNTVRPHPDQQAALRIVNVLSGKREKLNSDTWQKIIGKKDCFVIAVACSDLGDVGLSKADFDLALFGVGPAEIDVKAKRYIGNSTIPHFSKNNEKLVDMGLFFSRKFESVSAVLASPTNTIFPEISDHILYINPAATNPLPECFREPFSLRICSAKIDGGYTLTNKKK